MPDITMKSRLSLPLSLNKVNKPSESFSTQCFRKQLLIEQGQQVIQVMLNHHAEATQTSSHFKNRILNRHKIRVSIFLNGDYKTNVMRRNYHLINAFYEGRGESSSILTIIIQPMSD